MKNCLPLIALLLALTSCAEPLPNDRLDYVGEWQSKQMYLLILKDGTVAYQRYKSGGSVSVNGPLKNFIGNNFEVGLLFMTTVFSVSNPPYEENGVWKMTVDGVELTRTRD